MVNFSSMQVAAQNCRKRKLDQILHLADEVKAIQNRKNDLYNEYEYLNSERNRIKHKFSLLYRHIFQVCNQGVSYELLAY